MSGAATTTFKLRAARRGDAEPVRAILAELGHKADAATFTWTIQHPEMKVLVATDVLDKAIGVVALSHRPQLQLGGRVVTIDVLAVSQAWRRKGVGRELLAAAVKEAKIFDARRVEARALGSDAAASEFLARSGFGRLDDATYKLG